jgi:hypothetical protein
MELMQLPLEVISSLVDHVMGLQLLMVHQLGPDCLHLLRTVHPERWTL